MNIPIKILLSDAPTPANGLTWGDVINDWATYQQEWQNASALAVIQEEAPILDMFGDEGVSIKQVVKDLSDPSKLFTDFSRQFTIPASKKNNKILKHYYNIDIDNGLDTRETIPAKILLNNTTYKVGNISIEGTKMSNGKPMAYRIRFYGKLSELAKRIGADELTNMDWSNIDIDNYDAKALFETSTFSDVVFPLATLGDRYMVDSQDSSAAVGLDKTRNIKYVNATRVGNNYGFGSDDLVGALRVKTILDKISSTYGISFSGVFNEPNVQDLYLWLNKVDKRRDAEAVTRMLTSLNGSTSGVDYNVNNGVIYLSSTPQGVYHKIDFRVGTAINDFTVTMFVGGVAHSTVTTTNTWSNVFLSDTNQSIRFEVTTAGTGTIDFDVRIDEYDYSDDYYFEDRAFTGQMVVGSNTSFFISQAIPKMKVMDFLSSLFKMFNIVATVDETLNVKGEWYDYFMSKGNTIDISKYAEVSSYDVAKPNLYSSIDFQFSKPKTALEQGYQKVNGKNYGQLIYQLSTENGYRLSGAAFKLAVKNQRIPLENLTDVGNNLLSGICYTQFSNLGGQPQQTDPAFTYLIKQVDPQLNVAWDNGFTIDSITTYLMPSNMFSLNGIKPTNNQNLFQHGLYFSDELNEHGLTVQTNGTSLWNYFYKGLTSMMFNEDKRRVQISAHIPAGIIINMSLSDTLVISNQFFSINSIDTNYLTGVSKLDLTLVGKKKLPNFTVNTQTITNPSSTEPLRIMYLSQNGALTNQQLAPSASKVITKVGNVIWNSTNDSHIFDI